MEIANQKLPRRSFLVGAASAVGAASVGFAPGLAVAATRQSSADCLGSSVLSLSFWDGTSFVPAEAAKGPAAPERVLIEIFEDPHSGVGRSVDVQMPGGVFHAFVGGHGGSTVAKFPAPVHPAHGLGFKVFQDGESRNFHLGGPSQPSLCVGLYLVHESKVSLETAHWSDSDGELLRADGSKIRTAYTVIRVRAC